jgi:uncharacterized protein
VSAADITLEGLSPVMAAADRIDVLLLGMGEAIVPLDPAIRWALRERHVIVEAIGTGSAVRTYNVLLAEQRRVAAALIAVENAK